LLDTDELIWSAALFNAALGEADPDIIELMLV
jgi:hypothetical protein